MTFRPVHRYKNDQAICFTGDTKQMAPYRTLQMFASKASCMISFCLHLLSNLGENQHFRSHTTKRNSEGDYKILILLFNSCGWEWKGAFPQSLGKGKPKGILKTIHTTQLKRLKDRLSELTASLDSFYNRERKLAPGEALVQLWQTLSSFLTGENPQGDMLDNLSAEIKHQKLCCVNELPFPLYHLPQLLLGTNHIFLRYFFNFKLYYFMCCGINTLLCQWNWLWFSFLLPPCSCLFQPISDLRFHAWTLSLQKSFQREL